MADRDELLVLADRVSDVERIVSESRGICGMLSELNTQSVSANEAAAGAARLLGEAVDELSVIESALRQRL